MNQHDLFSYPSHPGFKVHGTSEEAATAMEGRADTLRRRAYNFLLMQDLTADEVANAMEESVLAVRPRITELRRMGRIEPTGTRRKNASGMSAIVWRAKNHNHQTT